MPKRTKKKSARPKPIASRAQGSQQLQDRPQTRWTLDQLDGESYIALVICIVAMLATILITWPTWQVRNVPPNLPWLGLIGVDWSPPLPFGILLVGSLALAAAIPKKMGVAIHLGVLFIAVMFDQFRCQPQVIGIAVMMAGCVWLSFRQIATWFLVSMWIWAGVHKLISPDWCGVVVGEIISEFGIAPSNNYLAVAIVIALSEIGLGCLAILRPQFAGVACLTLHIGIVSFLVAAKWNYSVIPWNICTALVGCWFLFKSPTIRSLAGVATQRMAFPTKGWQVAIVAGLFVVPAGFYLGLVRHSFAHVLYSANTPRAAVTKGGTVTLLEGWGELGFAFPHEQSVFRQYFRSTARAGQKLHIWEPRSFLDSHFYVMNDKSQMSEIDAASFYAKGPQISGGLAPNGIGCDNLRAVFQLELAGARLIKRSKRALIFAVEFEPERFTPQLLNLLSGVPNVEEIQLRGCRVSGSDLKRLDGLFQLTSIGLNDTDVTRQGLRHLENQANLSLIQFQSKDYTSLDDALRDSDQKDASETGDSQQQAANDD